jgi:signal transduction histidine kinase
MKGAAPAASSVVGSAVDRQFVEVTTSVLTPSLRLALESRWSTSPFVWAVAVPFQMFGSLLRNNGFYPNSTGALILIVFAGQLAALAMLLLAGSQRRPGRPLESMTWVQVIVLWAACGVVLSIVLHAGFNSLAGSAGVAGIGLGSRLLYLTGVTILGYLAVTYLADGVVRTQMQVSRLRRANERIIELESQSQSFVDAQSRLLTQTLNEQVIPDLQLLAEEAEALVAVAPTRALEALQARVAYYSETIVRTLSRDITDDVPSHRADAHDHLPTFGFSVPVLLRMVLQSPVRLIPTGLLLSVIVFQQMVPSCLSRAGLMWLSVIGAVAIGNLLAWTWLSMVRRGVVSGSGNVGAVGNALQYALMIAAFTWATKTPAVACEWQGGTIDLMVVLLTGFCAVAVLSVVLETSRRSAESVVILESLVRDGEGIAADLDREGERIRDRVALVLHGSVQGRLTAIALAIRAYVEELAGGGSPDHRLLLQRVTELLERALSDVRAIFGEEKSPLSVEAQLQALQGQWAGLIDIAWRMSPRAAELLGGDPNLAEWVQEIVGEAVTNASRHGRAYSAQIRLDVDRETGTRLVVTATDDGVGPPSGLRPGLGVERMQSRGGSWTLKPGPDGTGSVMMVILPAAPVACEKPDTSADKGALHGRI